MERVLIVAKTRMNHCHACIGGLNVNTGKNVRLLLPGVCYPLADTVFQVGQMWDMSLSPVATITPPHVEDSIVYDKVYIGQIDDMRTTLLKIVHPWTGGLAQLFHGRLHIGSTSGYISPNTALPPCSTGFWLTPHPLVLKCYQIDQSNDKPYYHLCLPIPGNPHRDYLSSLKIPYVGFHKPVPELPANTLVRVSLARWWAPEGFIEKRCHLQLSGWYL